ncbi:hypothetical protein AB0M02_10200 [Actinoplanes sp. NPDC051861]|uniref:hypothetical protein n=1 Tax=Actinoplanes sp. NPDC051861 TaxID=3155170 RepID=UPI00341C895A
MAGPSFAERVASALLTVAARRWPSDVAGPMRREWAAELACLRDRPGRMLTFAASLAVSSPRRFPWPAIAAPALLVLIAAALFNGVRQSLHLAETALPWSGEAALVGTLLAASCLLMAAAGARWAPRHPSRATLVTAFFAYVFLLAGNETPVMPFMGWREIAPTILSWTVVTAATCRATRHLRTTGRPRVAALAALTGGFLAVEAAAITGCLHAAAALGVPAASAPAWFPLAMLPGGTGGFGPALGAFHASDILLATAATLTGPLLLCTAFLTAALLSPARTATPRKVFTRLDPRIAGGTLTAAAVLLLAPRLPRSTTAEAVLPRLADNSTVFGFGFLAHPAGPAALALAVALLVAHHLADRRPLTL